MSLVEVKKSIAEMNLEERLEVAALISHLNRADDSGFQAEMDQRMTAMDAGRKHSANELELRHDDLSRIRR